MINKMKRQAATARWRAKPSNKKKIAKARKKTYERCKREGLCTVCAKHSSMIGKVYCARCARLKAVSTRARMESPKRRAEHLTSQRASTKKLRTWRKRKGLCKYCGQTSAAGKSACASCRTKKSKIQNKMVARRKRMGLCPCGQPPLIGNINCVSCKWKSFIRGLRNNAKNNRRHVGVSNATLRRIAKMPCHYCGGMDAKGFNGIDRKDSTRGYVVGNMLPCCWLHNRMKSNIAYKTYVQAILRAASYLRKAA